MRQPRILSGERLPDDACGVRIVPLPSAFDPSQLRVSIDRLETRPEGISVAGDCCYALKGDVLRITDQACTCIRSRARRPVLISLRYGACRIWE